MAPTLLMVGTLKDGYTFYGPFGNAAHAKKFGEKHFASILPYVTAELNGPAALTEALKHNEEKVAA